MQTENVSEGWGQQMKTVPIDDNFEMMLECAERYAIGRHSYLPPEVASYIKYKLPYVSVKCLTVLYNDILGEFRHREQMNWDLSYRKEWQELLDAVRAELEKRDKDETTEGTADR